MVNGRHASIVSQKHARHLSIRILRAGPVMMVVTTAVTIASRSRAAAIPALVVVMVMMFDAFLRPVVISTAIAFFLRWIAWPLIPAAAVAGRVLPAPCN